MPNHDTMLKPIDYSNTIVAQNEDSASVVSVIPLVGVEQEKPEFTMEMSQTPPTTAPQTVSSVGSSVGSGY